MTFTESLCRRHRAWAVDQTQYEEVPCGWHKLVARLFEAIATVMAEHPGQKLAVSQIKAKFGGLRVYLSTAGEDEDARAPVPDAVRRLVAEAEHRSFVTCDRCGAPGRAGAGRGRYATRCDSCAAPGSVPVADTVANPSGEDAEDEDTDATAPDPHVTPSSALIAPQDEPAATATRSGSARPRPRGPRSLSGVAAMTVPAGTAPASARRVALYTLDDVAAALGQKRSDEAELDDDSFMGDPAEREPPPPRSDSEHDARLRDLLRAGEPGCWRDLAAVPEGALAALDDLGRRAPHLDAMTALVRRHLRAATTIGLPVSLPPVLLLGPPGVGKSWYMARLAAALGLPFRVYPMNAATLGEGLTGSHPSWRNSGPGLVAKTLLRERVANPVILVDEFDKAQGNGWSRDPYSAFYSLLDPANARALADEYLQFAMDASHVIWVLSGNEVTPIPEPILDRLTVLTVPPLGANELRAVARSIYADANAARLGFFDPEPAEEVLHGLRTLTPRSIRVVLDDAMVSAAAEGRRSLLPADLRPRGQGAKRRIGF